MREIAVFGAYHIRFKNAIDGTFRQGGRECQEEHVVIPCPLQLPERKSLLPADQNGLDGSKIKPFGKRSKLREEIGDRERLEKLIISCVIGLEISKF